MFYDKFLKDDEQLVMIVRSNPIAFFWSFLISLIFLLIPFLVMVPLFKIGAAGMGVFWVSVLIGVILLLRVLVKAYFNSLVITDQRVVDWDQRGLFDRVISEADYDKIQDISYRIKGPISTLFRFGTLQIQTAGAVLVLELNYVRDPQKIQSLLTDIKRNYNLGSRE